MKHNIHKDSRLVYVDPNDVHGNVNGVPTTPDYTNFSIWCNLVVERSSRLKNQAGGTNDNELYSIYFDLSKGDTGTEFVSFMRGKDAERYNFLTTDYTNIDFNEIRNRNIMEGLQIESINISFVNYQTPLVTIKFVDIRGGGFFGREEATHDELGRLTNLETGEGGKQYDNFYSCFVSFPYPRFKLQVKGFYGKAVTFQLTCTSFNGKFNSQTGNFEITVQFIGYEFGILGDIPFDFLVAAPLTTVGGQHWDANVNSKRWALSADGEPPCKLFDFYNNIHAAIEGTGGEKSVEDMVQDEDLADSIANIAVQKSDLNKISEALKDFKDKVKQFTNDSVLEYKNPKEQEELMILFSNSSLVSRDSNMEAFCKAYNTLTEAIENYINLYDDKNISDEIIPNITSGGDWVDWAPKTLEYMEMFAFNNSGENKNIVIRALDKYNRQSQSALLDGGSCVDYKINKLFSSEQYEISAGVSQEIYNNIGKLKGYALAIDFGNITDVLTNALLELNIREKEYLDQKNDMSRRRIKDIVGFTPYIGRYFKVVMCHLETFVHLMNKCAEVIDGQILDDKENNGIRTPANLGIKNLSYESDVPGDVFKHVPPFPGVFKNYTSDEEAESDMNNGSNIVQNAWIGDFKGDWEEKNLVDDLFRAIQRIESKRTETQQSMSAAGVKRTTFLSLNPVDRLNSAPLYAYSTKDGAMFYAGLRAEMALNFMQGGKDMDDKKNEIAEKLGMIDAYNYYKQVSNKPRYKMIFGGTDVPKELYNCIVYDNKFDGDERLFEFTKVYKNRHPVFGNLEDEDGEQIKDRIEYKYMTNGKTRDEYIPLTDFNTFSKNNAFGEDFIYDDENNFTPRPDKTNYLIGFPGGDDYHFDNHKTNQHFNVIQDKEEVDAIKSAYREYTDGKFSIMDKKSSEFVSVLKRHVLVGEDDFKKYIDKSKNKSYGQLKISVDNIMNNGDHKALVDKFIKNVTY